MHLNSQRNNVLTRLLYSADLWIPSQKCSADICPTSRFDSAQSTTFKDLQQKFSITYGTAYARGEFGTDRVSLAGVIVPNQQIAVVNDTTGLLNVNHDSSNKLQPNGILGLGYPGLTSAPRGVKSYNPLLFSMVQQNLIPKPIFSFFMGKDMESIGWTGELVLGGTNSEKYSGDIKYAPVVTDSKSAPFDLWQTDSFGLSMTGGSSPIEMKQNRKAVIDTGTTLTYLDMDLAKKTLSSITGQQNFTVTAESSIFLIDCSYRNTTARFQMKLLSSNSNSSVVVDMPAASLIFPLDSAQLDSATTCGWGIVGSDKSEQPFVIGQSVLRNIYLVFDMGQNTIGFGAAVNSTTIVSEQAV